MELRRTTLSLLLSVFLLVSCLDARAASQARATLLVNIQPMAYFEVPSSLLWDNAVAGASLGIPLTLKVRLNRGTHADLSISRRDLPVLEPRLEVEGVNGISEMSEAPFVLRQFSRSGVYSHSVLVRVSSAAAGASGVIPMRVRLTLSDGSAEWSVSVTLHWRNP